MKDSRAFLTVVVFSLLLSVSLIAPDVHGADVTVETDTTWDAAAVPAGIDTLWVKTGAKLTLDGAVQIDAVNITVDAVAAISATGTGHGPGAGLGAGLLTGFYGGGGAYGGRGGDSSDSQGGEIYGSAVAPLDMGSGGGNGGGAGGGAIRLVVSGALRVNGTLSCDGESPSTGNVGAGAGGSIYITTGTLEGSGAITANGGASYLFGYSSGGGGGGRIAVHYGASTFTGTATASAGAGDNSSAEEAGTVGFFDTTNATFMAGPTWRFQANDAAFDLASYTLPDGTTATMEESITFGATTDIVVAAGASLSLYAPANFMTIQAENVTVESGGMLSATAAGHGAGEGLGAGLLAASYGGGGAYGGRGGDSTDSQGGEIYGSAVAPVDLGSGGGNGGGAGGGAIRLVVSGTLSANGTIACDGESPSTGDVGGGAGGSIYITTGTFEGSGAITANGGTSYLFGYSSGGGGGGRIAVYYGTSTFTGTATANAGEGDFSSGEEAGTVGFFDSTNATFVAGPTWRFQANDATFGLASYTLPTGSTVTMEEDITFGASTDIVVADSASLSLYAPANHLTIEADNITVQSGGLLSASASGHASDEGLGAGLLSAFYGGGGAYGGRGGDSNDSQGGEIYGSAVAPVDLGSGGGNGGGAGGGALRLVVSGTLQVDGTIACDGESLDNRGDAGGGAGGSVHITTGTFAGNGAITANGGASYLFGYSSGGGGGGRIAVHFGTSTFNGTATAAAGKGDFSSGEEAGTVGFFDSTNATFTAGPTWRFQANDATFDLASYTLPSGASATMEEGITFGAATDVVVAGGASLSLYAPANFLTIQAENITVASGGTLSASASGHASDEGEGAGLLTAFYGGGGAYGGRGGDSNDSQGGEIYGSAEAPIDLGSGGGNGGGAGGGAIQLVVSGTLQVDGTIACNGESLNDRGDAGGGAGGSVYITTGTFAGTGALTANGGASYLFGYSAGGGGGGRIAVHYGTSTFTGTAAASPGEGDLSSGEEAGTVGFFDTTNATFAAGPTWRFQLNDSPFELASYTLRPTTIASIEEGVVFGETTDFVLEGLEEDGAKLAPYAPANFLTMDLENLTIMPEAILTADAAGHGAGQGEGAGLLTGFYGGGGAHGGRGGDSVDSQGGEIYGSAVRPVALGSGGGNGGGAGGGAIRLVVSGALQVDGAIACDGETLTSRGDAGGGSGGSVYITTGMFSGSGGPFQPTGEPATSLAIPQAAAAGDASPSITASPNSPARPRPTRARATSVRTRSTGPLDSSTPRTPPLPPDPHGDSNSATAPLN